MPLPLKENVAGLIEEFYAGSRDVYFHRISRNPVIECDNTDREAF